MNDMSPEQRGQHSNEPTGNTSSDDELYEEAMRGLSEEDRRAMEEENRRVNTDKPKISIERQREMDQGHGRLVGCTFLLLLVGGIIGALLWDQWNYRNPTIANPSAPPSEQVVIVPPFAGTPSEQDPAVVQKVREVSYQLTRNQTLINTLTSEMALEWALHQDQWPSPQYEAWSQQQGQNPQIRRIVQLVDEKMRLVQMEVKNLIPTRKDTDLRRIEFMGTIDYHNGTTTPIYGSAQYDNQGQLMVVVSFTPLRT